MLLFLALLRNFVRHTTAVDGLNFAGQTDLSEVSFLYRELHDEASEFS